MVNGILKKIFIISILTIVFSTGFFNVREVSAQSGTSTEEIAAAASLKEKLKNEFNWEENSQDLEVTYNNRKIKVRPTGALDNGRVVWGQVGNNITTENRVTLVLEPTSNSQNSKVTIKGSSYAGSAFSNTDRYFEITKSKNPLLDAAFEKGRVADPFLSTARKEDMSQIAAGTYVRDSEGFWTNSSDPGNKYMIVKANDGTLRVVSKKGADGKEKIKNVLTVAEAEAAAVSIYCDGYFNFSCWIANLAYHVVFTVAAKILTISGTLFDFVVEHTVLKMSENMGLSGAGMSAESKDASTIYDVWRIFRDITNILFIFTLLYISIKTILQGTGETARQIGTVIIVAVTINFSLLVTKIVIDFSNILSLNFYTEIQDNVIKSTSGNEEKTIAKAFVAKTNVATIVKEATATADAAVEGAPVINYISITKQSLLGSAIVLVVAFVLFVMSGMLISRFIILMIIMITSSIAFGSYLIPKLRTMIADKWWEALFGQAMFAPTFFLFLFVSLKVLEKLKFGVNSTHSFSGDLLQADPAVFITFIMTIAMLLASLKIAKNMSDKAGAVSGKVNGMVSGLALGTARLAGGMSGRVASRAVASTGRFALGGLGNKMVKAAGDGDSKLARLGRWTGSSLASSSYDVRNTKTGQAVAAKLGIKNGITGVGAGSGVGGVAKMKKDASDEQKKRVAEMEATYKKKTQFTDEEQDTMNIVNEYRSKSENADAIREYDRADSIVKNSTSTLATFDTNRAKHEAELASAITNEKKEEAKRKIAEIDKAKKAHEDEVAKAKEHMDNSAYKTHKEAEQRIDAAKKQRGRDFMAANMSTDAGKAFNRQQIAKNLKQKNPQTDEIVAGLLDAAREMGGGAGGAGGAAKT